MNQSMELAAWGFVALGVGLERLSLSILTDEGIDGRRGHD